MREFDLNLNFTHFHNVFFQELDASLVAMLISRDDLSVASGEHEVFEIVLNWATEKFKSETGELNLDMTTHNALSLIFSKIRWPLMSIEYLFSTVEKNTLIQRR